MSQTDVSTNAEQRAAETRRRYRLLVLASHVIQMDGPWYQNLAAHPEIDLTVLYCSRWGLNDPPADACFGRTKAWDRPLLEGYRHQFLSNLNPMGLLPGKFWTLINPGIIRYVMRGRYDALIVNGWAYPTDWLAFLAGFASGTPVLVRGDSNVVAKPKNRFKAGLKRVVLDALFRHCSGILASGHYNAEFYRMYGVPDSKIFPVPFCVDNDFFLAKADEFLPRKRELKQALGIDPDAVVILCCGRLAEVKRPLDLLRAFELSGRSKAVVLAYAGDGPLRATIESYVKENRIKGVYLLGFRNQSELPRVCAAADVFVLPSGSEPWGLVVNEAMCFGLPVIASDKVGASGDLVRPRVNGFIVHSGDVEGLAGCLQVLSEDSTLRSKMGAASREIIGTWNYTAATEGVVSCLRSLSGRRKHPESQ